MDIRKATLSDLSIIKRISEVTISEIYPHYYPKGAVDFFLEHHSKGNILDDIKKGIVYLCFDASQNAVGTVTIKNNEICRLFVLPSYQNKGVGTEMLDFAEKMGKEDPEEYISSGGWKARQGGAGLELSKNVNVSFKPCATDENSFNYSLNKPIDDTLYELFKVFGKLNFEMGNARLGEVYILNPQTEMPIMKLKGKKGQTELKVTVIQKPIAKKTKNVEIEQKIKCQITKFQLCVGCHACENACKINAIKLKKKGSSDSEYDYIIDDSKCVNCFACIDHYQGGCYMRRVLLPRGKNYGK